ncbi:sugar porter family MFS transporter [Aquicella lusitana]|uniref:Sugar porter (SP) family MFS transporter n=1 Tax=Aquicella lusitana TaxID=254246 RepID=A0A370GDR9_9COXI|nr:sugar porter family MFS transporter [Aquicella lusitana]RDI41837.1 sugar porter (SP) family MFS transporter [Aquicella lusitana]VVC73745.1 putative metabolite transport protein CsbC [Aquicella lusitana]
MAIYLVCAIAALAGLLFGFDTGIISGALLFIEKGFPLTTVMKELIVSSVLLGAMAGSLLSGRLTDYYGRRKIILIISGMFIIGTLIASLAPNVNAILLGRLCIGIAIGIGSYTAPLYIAEVAPLELRGGLVSLNQLAITIGIMCSYFINYAFTNTEGSWRLMFAIGLIPAILLCIGMFFLPESPRWLVKQKRLREAKATLSYLRRTAHVDQEVAEIERSLNVHQAKLSEIFAPWIRPVLFLGIMLGFLQQVVGINTIIYYAPTIFQLAGFQDTSTSILATVGIGIVNVIATIFAVLYLDKLGRRVLLLTGLVGMCLSLLALSLAFQWDSAYLRWIAVFSTFTYVISFAFSLGAMLWLLVSEIFPLDVRGAAMGVAVFSCWFWNFAVSSTFLSLLNALGPTNTFLLYASMCVVGFVFCYYKVPETNNVSLEKIEDNIRRGLPLREIGQPVSVAPGKALQKPV